MKYVLKFFAVITFLSFIPGIIVKGNPAFVGIDKNAFYAAMAGNDLNKINTVLADMTMNATVADLAFEGALMMKKAGLLSKPKEKLHTFKAGRQKLEAAILNDPDNIEYRFLRLMIQENAPKIVKYKNDIENDNRLIRNSFKKLSPVIQQAIKDYSKKSKVLIITGAFQINAPFKVVVGEDTHHGVPLLAGVSTSQRQFEIHPS